MTSKAVIKQEQDITESERREVAERGSEPLMVSANYVQQTVKSIALLQDMTRTLLHRGRDYGRTPGTPQDGLWDPGASLIIASFNCYCGQRRVISLVENEEKISIIVEVPIISHQTGQEVGSGIGAASSLETKHRWRYFTPDELKDMGYSEEQFKTLHKSRSDAQRGKYGIENPEFQELLNTLTKMASKRAEVDAAESLPGVASVLREMFTPEKPGRDTKTETATKYQGPKWQHFWGEATRLGYTEAETHTELKVKSMQDWLAAGKSLDDAINELVRLAAEASGMSDPKVTESGGRSEGRGYDKTMIRAAASKLKWDAKTLNKELKERSGFSDTTLIPDDKLHKIASDLTTMAEVA